MMDGRLENVPRAELIHHELYDPHREESSISDVILGGQDGLVNVLGVVLGVAAASDEVRMVLVAGLAATFAESVSMAAVAYTSTLARADLYESERAREYRHVDHTPILEREEVKEIYRRKGFEGEFLEQLVDTITANKDVWVAVMMAEEHKVAPVSRGGALRSSLVVGLSSIVGSLIPLLPFFFFSRELGILASIAISAIVLFAVGAYKATRTVGRPAKSGFEMMAIGIASAMVGYAVGLLFKIAP
jgi:predicted membrane protein (TIGR00267 family)